MTNATTQPKFSVITAVYNRQAVLHRAFHSLKNQVTRDFEWIVVNDGSTDGSAEVIAAYAAEADFPVVVVNKPNGGLHTALNAGVRAASGEFFVQLDSDDACIPEAFRTFSEIWATIPEAERMNYSGVNVCCFDPETGEMVGTPYPGSPLDTNNLELDYRYKIEGEHWGCVRLDCMREYPFPEPKEKTVVPEAFVWYRLARKYKVRCVNIALRAYYRDQSDAMSTSLVRRSDAEGFFAFNAFMLRENSDYLLRNLDRSVRIAAGSWRYARHLGYGLMQWRKELGKSALLASVTIPLGELLYQKDRRRQAAENASPTAGK